MKPLHALMCVLLVAIGSSAAPPETGIIKETELEPHLKEYFQQVMLAQQGKLQTATLIARYERKAQQAASRREKAIITYILAELYSYANREDEARSECARALEYFEGFAAAHVMIGRLAARKKDMRTAKARFDRALEVEPDNIAARIWLAKLQEFKNTDAGLHKARRYYEQALEIRPMPIALEGLTRVSVQLFQRSFNDREKTKYAERAINSAKAWRVLDPESVMAIMHLAEVYVKLGRYGRSIEFLEKVSNEDYPERAKLHFYDSLTQLYMQTNQPKRVAESLRRMLKLNMVTGKDREQLEKRLKDVEGNGSMAFKLWEIELLLVMLQNDGLSEQKRHYALRLLLDKLRDPWMTTEEGLAVAQRKIFDASMRVLINAPPSIALEMFKYFRQYNRSPRLIRILVHFVYPYDDKERTPEVRASAVRTLAEVSDLASLPTLLYCLRDEPGVVVREVDKALVRVCETRSVGGEGVAPFNEEEKTKVRRFWYRFKHTAEGGDRLVEAFADLRKSVEMNPKFNRENRTQPLLDHTIHVVLLDNELSWPAWKAGYEFFKDYLGKDFRPVALRDRPLEEDQRPQVVEAVRGWWRGNDSTRLKEPSPRATDSVDAPGSGD